MSNLLFIYNRENEQVSFTILQNTIKKMKFTEKAIYGTNV